MNKLMKLSLLVISMTLAISFQSCSKDDEVEKTKTLYVGDTMKIENGATTENEFVAYISDGNLIASHVGKTKVNNNGTVFELEVLGRHSMDIQLNWDLTPDQIKENQKKGILKSDAVEWDARFIVYAESGYANLLTYAFEDDKLKIIRFYTNISNQEEVTNYLKERYFFDKQLYNGKKFIGMDALKQSDMSSSVTLTIIPDNKPEYKLEVTFMKK